MSDKPIYLKKNQMLAVMFSDDSEHNLFFFFEIFIIQIFFRKHEIILKMEKAKFVCV